MPISGTDLATVLKSQRALGKQVATLDDLADQMNAAAEAIGLRTRQGVATFYASVVHETAWLRTYTEYGSDLRYDPYRGRGAIQTTWREGYASVGRFLHARGLVTDPDVFVKNPTSLSDPRWAWWTGIEFYLRPRSGAAWTVGGVTYKTLADLANSPAGSIDVIGKAINRGNPSAKSLPYGYAERRALYAAFYALGERIVPSKPATPAPTKPAPIRILTPPRQQASGRTQLAETQAAWRSNLRAPVSDVSVLQACLRLIEHRLAKHKPYVYEDNVRETVDYSGHGKVSGDSYHYRFQPIWFAGAKDARGPALAADLNFRQDERVGIGEAKKIARQCGIAYNDEGDHLHLDCGPYVNEGRGWTTPLWVGRPTNGLLRVDGDWGTATTMRLNYVAYGQPDKTFNTHTVRVVQGELNKHGAGLVVDGAFGPKTQAAFCSRLGTKQPLTTRWAVGLLQQSLNLGRI